MLFKTTIHVFCVTNSIIKNYRIYQKEHVPQCNSVLLIVGTPMELFGTNKIPYIMLWTHGHDLSDFGPFIVFKSLWNLFKLINRQEMPLIGIGSNPDTLTTNQIIEPEKDFHCSSHGSRHSRRQLRTRLTAAAAGSASTRRLQTF